MSVGSEFILCSQSKMSLFLFASSSHFGPSRGKWSTPHICPTSSLSTSFVPCSFLKSKLPSDASTHEDSEPYLWSDSSYRLGVSNGLLHLGLTSAHRVGFVRGCCADGISPIVQTIGDLGLCSESTRPPPNMCGCVVRPSADGLMSLKRPEYAGANLATIGGPHPLHRMQAQALQANIFYRYTQCRAVKPGSKYSWSRLASGQCQPKDRLQVMR